MSDMMGVHDLRLEVDTGTSDITMPTRIAKYMYGNQWQSKAEQAKRTKLKACNGSEMKCFGTLKILFQYKDSEWRKYKLYIVDVPGPAILGLRACEQMRIMKIHSNKSCKDLKKVTINLIGDLKKTFPDRFDCIGSFHPKKSTEIPLDVTVDNILTDNNVRVCECVFVFVCVCLFVCLFVCLT